MSKLLSMFTPKSPSLNPTGGGGDITPEMVASACTGLSKKLFFYGLYKFAGDNSVTPELDCLLFSDVLSTAKRKRWKLTSGENGLLFQRLAQMALADVTVERHCKKCNGTKVNGEQRECKACSGSGKRPPESEANKAKRLGVSIEAWNRRWRQRYTVVLSQYLTWDDKIDAVLKRQLFRSDDDDKI